MFFLVVIAGFFLGAVTILSAFIANYFLKKFLENMNSGIDIQ